MMDPRARTQPSPRRPEDSAKSQDRIVAAHNDTLLLAEHVCKTYPGKVRALDDVSLKLARGEVLGIVGESGSGKSTLARVLCGLMPPEAGTVVIDGESILTCPRARRAGLVQMIFQDPFSSLNPRLSVRTQLAEAAAGGQAGNIERVLSDVELPSSVLDAYPHQFSGGQRQRIAIARALLKRPAIIIADEPVSALDVTTQSQVIGLFQRVNRERDTAFIFISHDLAVTSMIADRIIIMQNGRIVEEGETTVVTTTPNTDYARRLLSAVPVLKID